MTDVEQQQPKGPQNGHYEEGEGLDGGEEMVADGAEAPVNPDTEGSKINASKNEEDAG